MGGGARKGSGGSGGQGSQAGQGESGGREEDGGERGREGGREGGGGVKRIKRPGVGLLCPSATASPGTGGVAAAAGISWEMVKGLGSGRVRLVLPCLLRIGVGVGNWQ